MSKKEKKLELLGDERIIMRYILDEIKEIRQYVNDAHNSMIKLSERVGNIEGKMGIIVKIGVPLLGTLLSIIVSLLIKLVFGI